MTPALVNILLAALAVCNAHATFYRPDATPAEIMTGSVNAGMRWEPGFEQCVTVAPIAATRLKAYFAEKAKVDAKTHWREDQAAVAKAAAALAKSP